MVNDCLQDDIVSVDIIPSIKSDHSAITLSINGIDNSERGPSFWKFNCSLVNDNNYCDLLDTNGTGTSSSSNVTLTTKHVLRLNPLLLEDLLFHFTVLHNFFNNFFLTTSSFN